MQRSVPAPAPFRRAGNQPPRFFAGTERFGRAGAVKGVEFAMHTNISNHGSKIARWQKLLMLACSTVGIVTSLNAQNILINGSFEQGLSHWTSAGNVFHTPLSVVPDGAFLVDFNGFDTAPNGVISQTITTEVDVTYALDFTYGIIGGTGQVQKLGVSAIGIGTILNEEVSITSTGGINFDTFTFNFIADSALTTLVFSDRSLMTVSTDGLLDRVSVIAVPEPDGVAVVGFGALGLAIALRVRQIR